MRIVEISGLEERLIIAAGDKWNSQLVLILCRIAELPVHRRDQAPQIFIFRLHLVRAGIAEMPRRKRKRLKRRKGAVIGKDPQLDRCLIVGSPSSGEESRHTLLRIGCRLLAFLADPIERRKRSFAVTVPHRSFIELTAIARKRIQAFAGIAHPVVLERPDASVFGRIFPEIEIKNTFNVHIEVADEPKRDEHILAVPRPDKPLQPALARQNQIRSDGMAEALEHLNGKIFHEPHLFRIVCNRRRQSVDLFKLGLPEFGGGRFNRFTILRTRDGIRRTHRQIQHEWLTRLRKRSETERGCRPIPNDAFRQFGGADNCRHALPGIGEGTRLEIKRIRPTERLHLRLVRRIDIRGTLHRIVLAHPAHHHRHRQARFRGAVILNRHPNETCRQTHSRFAESI